jgi:hypothetical protein
MTDCSERRAWNAAVGLCCVTLTALIGLVAYSWLTNTPTPDEAIELARPNHLIAYSTDNRRPHLLTIDGDQLVFDRLRRDWSPVRHGDRPAWRETGFEYRLQRTPTPASGTLLMCAGDSHQECDRTIDLVGELRSEEITHVEIAVDGHWERHLVFGQGFIVPVDSRRKIGDIRWLNVHRDDDGVEVVWAIDRDLDGRISPIPLGQVSIRDVKRLQAH